MLRLLFCVAPPGQRKQQMAAWCLVSSVAIIIAGLMLLESPDLTALAVLAGAPAAAMQGIHAAGNVAEHRSRNGGTDGTAQ